MTQMYSPGTTVTGIGYRETTSIYGKPDGPFVGVILVCWSIIKPHAKFKSFSTYYRCETDNDGVWWAWGKDIRKHRPDQMEPGWEPKESR